MDCLGIDQIIKIGSKGTIIDPKYIQCSICCCIVRNPFECLNKKCKKIFCECCIQTANNNTLNKFCPYCRFTDKLSLCDTNIYSILKEIKVICLFIECKEQMSLSLYNSHINNCLGCRKYVSKDDKIKLLNVKANCNSCQKDITSVKIQTTKCSVCFKYYCKDCKFTYSCYNCKSNVCNLCLPSISKYNTNNHLHNEFLCGSCDITCKMCNSADASLICAICTKPLCQSHSTNHKSIVICKDAVCLFDIFKNKNCNICKKIISDTNNKLKISIDDGLIALSKLCNNCNKSCYLCKSSLSSKICSFCNKNICSSKCSFKCKSCKSIACKDCFHNCISCKENLCKNCLDTCSDCNEYSTCKKCLSDVLRPCNTNLLCKETKHNKICLSCWNVCNQCNTISCNQDTNTCLICESKCCNNHIYECNICNKNDSFKTVCSNSCSFKCSFCNNTSGLLCKKTNLFTDKNKNHLAKSEDKAHPYVHNLTCNHNVCDACIINCSKCPKDKKTIACPQCVSSYYYHYCRYCSNYQCNICSRYCKLCEENYCTTCKCAVCNKKVEGCGNCFYLNEVLKCKTCKERTEICSDCRKIKICSQKCYTKLNLTTSISKKHLCRMFECKSCFNISIGNKTDRVEKKINEVSFKKITKEPISAPESFKINNTTKTNSGKKIGTKKVKSKESNNCCCY